MSVRKVTDMYNIYESAKITEWKRFDQRVYRKHKMPIMLYRIINAKYMSFKFNNNTQIIQNDNNAGQALIRRKNNKYIIYYNMGMYLER